MTDRDEQLARARALAEARRAAEHAADAGSPVEQSAAGVGVADQRPRPARRKGPSAGRILAACAATAGGIGLVGVFAIGAQASAEPTEPAAAPQPQTIVLQVQVQSAEPGQSVMVPADVPQAQAAPQRAPVTESHGS